MSRTDEWVHQPEKKPGDHGEADGKCGSDHCASKWNRGRNNADAHRDTGRRQRGCHGLKITHPPEALVTTPIPVIATSAIAARNAICAATIKERMSGKSHIAPSYSSYHRRSMPPAQTASTPFASRELNGEVLIEELNDLRNAQVPIKLLSELVVGLRDLQGVRVSEAAQRLTHLAANRFSATPALSSLLVRWSKKLKVEPDVPLLVAHFERLAVTAAVVASVRRATESLKK